MKVLFDNGALGDHEVSYARIIGWHELKNGELLDQAETAGYHVLLSTDKTCATSKT